MYVDKLDGRIGGDFYDRFAGEWREEQNRLQREIDRHETAEQSYMDEGVQILELARNAQRLFAQQPPREKRRLLNFILSNCSWEGGEVVATFRQPFDLLAETTAMVVRQTAGKGDSSSSRAAEADRSPCRHEVQRSPLATSPSIDMATAQLGRRRQFELGSVSIAIQMKPPQEGGFSFRHLPPPT